MNRSKLAILYVILILKSSSASDVISNTTSSLSSSTSAPDSDSIWNPFTIWGAVAGAIIFTTGSMFVPFSLGFASSGIKMGSVAARMMSSSATGSGGGIVAGSLVAICQSVGALTVCSLGFIPIAIIVSIGATIGFGIGYGVKKVLDLLGNAGNDDTNMNVNSVYQQNLTSTSRILPIIPATTISRKSLLQEEIPNMEAKPSFATSSKLYANVSTPIVLHNNEDSIWDVYTICGTIIGAAIFTILILYLPTFLGFGRYSVLLGSPANKMITALRTNACGQILSDFMLFVCMAIQSRKVIAVIPVILFATIGAAIGFGIGDAVSSIVKSMNVVPLVNVNIHNYYMTSNVVVNMNANSATDTPAISALNKNETSVNKDAAVVDRNDSLNIASIEQKQTNANKTVETPAGENGVWPSIKAWSKNSWNTATNWSKNSWNTATNWVKNVTAPNGCGTA